jgi:hypothetical protein
MGIKNFFAHPDPGLAHKFIGWKTDKSISTLSATNHQLCIVKIYVLIFLFFFIIGGAVLSP